MATWKLFEGFIIIKNIPIFVEDRGAFNSVFHHNGIVHPLCNVIKDPHCMMSSAGALWVLALHGWIPKLWPNLSGMWLSQWGRGEGLHMGD